jgi:hypothetical protein
MQNKVKDCTWAVAETWSRLKVTRSCEMRTLKTLLSSSAIPRCDDAHRHPPPRSHSRHPGARHTQCIHHERRRCMRSVAVQLLPDSLARLHRHVAAGQLLRPRARECGPGDAHTRPAGYKCQGEKQGESRPCALLGTVLPHRRPHSRVEREMKMHQMRKIYEPPRYMSVPQAVAQPIEIEDTRKEVCSYLVGHSRVGAGPDNERIMCGTPHSSRSSRHMFSAIRFTVWRLSASDYTTSRLSTLRHSP